jgi:ribonuclease HII
MARALEAMNVQFPDCAPDCLFLDTLPWPEAPLDCPRVSILRGDQHALTIAAASVLAKTWRDAQMVELDAQHPDYGFALHKGYGTARHQAALRANGASPAHRLSFKPLRALTAPSLL